MEQLEVSRKRINFPSFEEILNEDRRHPRPSQDTIRKQAMNSAPSTLPQPTMSRDSLQRSDAATKGTSDETSTSNRTESQPADEIASEAAPTTPSQTTTNEKIPEIEFDYDRLRSDDATSYAFPAAHPGLYGKQIESEAQHLQILGLEPSRPSGRRRSLFPKV